MQLALVIYGSLSTTTGGYLYDRRFVRYLREQGDAVDVIRLPRTSYPRALLHNFNPWVRDRLAAPSVDVLVQDELCHPSLVRPNRRRVTDAPIVSIVHHLRSCEPHPTLRNRLYRTVERRYLRSIDGVICASRTTQTDVDRLGSGSMPGVVAYPGTGRFEPNVEPAQVTDRAQAPGPLRILFVGAIIPRKGVQTLVRAVARLPVAEWRLTIVGDRTVDPAYVKSLDRELRRLGIEDAVRFTGRIPKAALAEELARAHVIAGPSTYEGLGLAYLEAMGFGVVPVATTEGGPREIIDHGVTGLLIPPDDVEALARAIQPLVSDRDRLARLGRGALRRHAAHPTWAESMATARAFLDRIADRPPTDPVSADPA